MQGQDSSYGLDPPRRKPSREPLPQEDKDSLLELKQENSKYHPVYAE